MTSEKIEHEGIVESVSEGIVRVKIQRKSACSVCHAKEMCSSADTENRIIEIVTFDKYEVGESVMVVGGYEMGLKAVFLSFIVPFLVVLLSLIIASKYCNEIWSGIIALSSLLPYYTVLYLFKERLKRKFSFYIERN